ncbi:AI-2E family transporter [Anoxybacillus sp. KU2-6(11)]|uniref:AI-2E family transporter n=1 Tax=Anoxybacillus sp. KU2-6(11) TaxID=1535751 RepID=UPI000B16D2A4|nr:AI-2E family transporter [Anoxybacillus sp. KU2-6(11)]
MPTQYVYRSLRFLFVIFIIVVGLASLYYVSTLTYPFLIALAIAFFINPVVDVLEKKAKMPRALAVIVVLILLLAFVAGLVTLLVAEIVTGTQYLATVVPNHFQKLVIYVEQFVASQIIPLYNQLATLFKNLDTSQQDTIMSNIQSVGTKIATTVGQFIQNLLQNIPSIIGWLPNFATIFIFSLLATFFYKQRLVSSKSIVSKIVTEQSTNEHDKSVSRIKKGAIWFS